MTKKLADFLPAKVRAGIYVALGSAAALEAIWDVIPNGWESRLWASLAVLGFTVATVNTPKT